MSMQISNNTLAAVEDYVLDRIKDLYPEREGAAIFGLACYVYLGLNQVDIRLSKNMKLSESEMVKFIHLTKRLRQNEPIQYILEQAFFLDFELEVSQDTLIPRPETEELVDWIITDEKESKSPVVLDIGTGTGCIALAINKGMPEAAVYAVDISKGAIDVARRNAAKYNLEVNFCVLDILESEAADPAPDIIVSNPPYIGKEEAESMESNVLDFEPETALFPKGDDVLVFYRRIAALAQKYKSRVYVEINRAHGEEICALFDTFGAVKTHLQKDLSGNNRMVKAIW
jgi:release factor glutamine methyltransferase